MSADTSGPAFPVVELDRISGNPCDQHFGLTLRDFFAAKALAGMASAYHDHWTVERAAEAAYELADAMLRERSK
jgi:hypothetical protein